MKLSLGLPEESLSLAGFPVRWTLKGVSRMEYRLIQIFTAFIWIIYTGLFFPAALVDHIFFTSVVVAAYLISYDPILIIEEEDNLWELTLIAGYDFFNVRRRTFRTSLLSAELRVVKKGENDNSLLLLSDAEDVVISRLMMKNILLKGVLDEFKLSNVKVVIRKRGKPKSSQELT